MGIAPYERVWENSVGADAYIGPHGVRKEFFGAPFSGSGADAETIR